MKTKKPKTPDLVNHPLHYTDGRYEHADVVMDWQLDYFLGRCTAHIKRHGKKGGMTALMDLEKAQWYLHRKVQLLKWPELTAKEADQQEEKDRRSAFDKQFRRELKGASELLSPKEHRLVLKLLALA